MGRTWDGARWRPAVAAATAAALAAVLFTGRAGADTTATEDFESYVLGSSINPADLAGGAFAAQWSSDADVGEVPTFIGSDNGAWRIADDAGGAPAAGQFMEMRGVSGAPPGASHWVAFEITDTGPILQARTSFSYRISDDVSSELELLVSETSPVAGLTPVTFDFVPRFGSGPFVDHTGTIDLTPFLSGTSASLWIVLRGECFIHPDDFIRIDDLHVETETSPPVGPPPAGPLGVDTAQLAYDWMSSPFVSLYKGPTNYVISGDFDGDLVPDVANVTNLGVQVFHNAGAPGGVLDLDLTQEFSAPFSYGGNAFDVDGDDDLDLVLADVTTLVIALNDGSGNFAVTRPVTHAFRQPSVAHAFSSGGASPETRILVGASADVVGGDGLGPNPLGLPFQYVLHPDGGGGWEVYQTLHAFNGDGVATADIDSDTHTDIVTSNRSGVLDVPFRIYQGHAGPASYTPAGPFDLSTYFFTFSHGPAVDSSGNVGIGTWQRLSYFPHTGAMTFGSPTHISLDPNGFYGFPTGETFASEFADMDLDGDDDLVSIARNTALELIRLTGDVNDTGNRFVAPPFASGHSMDLVLGDYDNDLYHAQDVIVGRSDGLWYFRNLAGDDTGVAPPPPTPPTASELILEAYQRIVAALDPEGSDPFGSDAPGFYHDELRNEMAEALADLAEIDPLFLTTGFVAGGTDPERVESLRSYWFDADDARDDLLDASEESTHAGQLAELVFLRGLLVAAQVDIVDQAHALGGAGFPFKRKPSKRLRNMLRDSIRDRNSIHSLLAQYRTTDDADRRDRLEVKIARLGRRSLANLVRYQRALGRRG